MSSWGNVSGALVGIRNGALIRRFLLNVRWPEKMLKLTNRLAPVRGSMEMFTEIKGFVPKRFVFAVFLLLTASVLAFSQDSNPYNSQEVSEADGIPVLIKHLPDWENVKPRLTFAQDVKTLKTALGDRPVLDLIDFSAGTEAVTAPYDAGKLLIVEYSTPQGSIDADNKINQRLAELGSDSGIAYRRIGNYNTFVFDASDAVAANLLIDQVKYEKNVRWLGDDPFMLRRAERAFINTTSDIFVSTVLWIVLGLGIAIVTGVAGGVLFYNRRKQKRRLVPNFTDAGGMTRLNLDGFTADIAPDRLLGD